MHEPKTFGPMLLAVAILVAGFAIAWSLFQFASAHGDLERACFEGGGSEFQAGAESLDRADEGIAHCYHPA